MPKRVKRLAGRFHRGSTSSARSRSPSPPPMEPVIPPVVGGPPVGAGQPLVVTLDFPATMKWQQDRLERFRHTQVGEVRFLDWTVLQDLGVSGAVESFIGVGQWPAFFALRAPSYRELTVEFLCTFSLTKNQGDWDMDGGVTFHLFGRGFRMSLNQFTQTLGLYTPEFMESPEYRQLPTVLPQSFNKQRFWSEITSDPAPYQGRLSKASNLRHPLARLIHSVFVHSITGRRESTGVVSATELYFLWSFFSHTPIHLGIALAEALDHHASVSGRGQLFVGPYVTILAERLGLQEGFQELVPVPMIGMSAKMIASLRLARKVAGVYHFTAAIPPGEFGVPLQAAAEHQEEDGAEDHAPYQEAHSPPVHDAAGPSASFSRAPDRAILRYLEEHSQRLSAMEATQRWQSQVLLDLAARFDISVPPPPPAFSSADFVVDSEELSPRFHPGAD